MQAAGHPERAVNATIVRAKIHPAMGIARVGNSVDEFFIGPEVTEPTPEAPGFYRDGTGALKRQAARFRLYGYDAQGHVVAELTTAEADIVWTAHLRNAKAAWYEFQLAMDIAEVAQANPASRRNGTIKGSDRADLVIDGGSVTIAGPGLAGPGYAFNGQFLGSDVDLGELQTDEAGHLVVLGGRGVSASPTDAPLPNFANNDGWHDDTADGPVSATVTIGGETIPVDPAWVVVAPPNYAPNLKTVRTLYDLVFDLFVQEGSLQAPKPVSFTGDILPILTRMSGLQWLNAGFAQTFGYGKPLDFDDPAFLTQVSRPDVDSAETRTQIANSFRDFGLDGPSRTPLPWLYGDAPSVQPTGDLHQNCALSLTQLACLRQWAKGNFATDYDPDFTPPGALDEVPLAEQPSMLDRAALDFCLADAFHPGCEVTWPIRHSTMYAEPFRIAHRPGDDPEPDYGDILTPSVALAPGGPLGPQSAGGLTRWMAVPWQTDTASCLSGYDPDYDPYLPTFWPARVPNQVLSASDYQTVVDPSQPRAQRLQAFRRRLSWPDALPGSTGPQRRAAMVWAFPYLGLVEQRAGVANDADLPPVMQVATDSTLLLFPWPEPGPVTSELARRAAKLAAAAVEEDESPHGGRFAWRRDPSA